MDAHYHFKTAAGLQSWWKATIVRIGDVSYAYLYLEEQWSALEVHELVMAGIPTVVVKSGQIHNLIERGDKGYMSPLKAMTYREDKDMVIY